jgi:hypothetical protein
MTTIRQAIQAKIDAANTLSANLSTELSTEDAKFSPTGPWLDEDPQAFAQRVADFQALVSKHSA